jgi:hypothetical protein
MRADALDAAILRERAILEDGSWPSGLELIPTERAALEADLRRLELRRAGRFMSEDELLTALLELLGFTGWRAFHIRRSDRAIVQGAGGAGFPDVVAAQPERHRLIAFECKSDRGIPTPEQLAWLLELRQHPTLEATIVRPSTYDQAIAWIRGVGPMPDARRSEFVDALDEYPPSAHDVTYDRREGNDRRA